MKFILHSLVFYIMIFPSKARQVPDLAKVQDLFPVHPEYKAAIPALEQQVVFQVLFPTGASPAGSPD
jgi:hypothetical protein